MDIDLDKLIKMVRRDMFSTVMLMKVLLEHCSTDRSELARLMEAVSADELERVYDVLSMYPVTELGWSILPPSRSPYLQSGMSREEEADVEGRQFQEDRKHVELLRESIRPTD